MRMRPSRAESPKHLLATIVGILLPQPDPTHDHAAAAKLAAFLLFAAVEVEVSTKCGRRAPPISSPTVLAERLLILPRRFSCIWIPLFGGRPRRCPEACEKGLISATLKLGNADDLRVAGAASSGWSPIRGTGLS